MSFEAGGCSFFLNFILGVRTSRCQWDYFRRVESRYVSAARWRGAPPPGELNRIAPLWCVCRLLRVLALHWSAVAYTLFRCRRRRRCAIAHLSPPSYIFHFPAIGISFLNDARPYVQFHSYCDLTSSSFRHWCPRGAVFYNIGGCAGFDKTEYIINWRFYTMIRVISKIIFVNNKNKVF